MKRVILLTRILWMCACVFHWNTHSEFGTYTKNKPRWNDANWPKPTTNYANMFYLAYMNYKGIVHFKGPTGASYIPLCFISFGKSAHNRGFSKWEISLTIFSIFCGENKIINYWRAGNTRQKWAVPFHSKVKRSRACVGSGHRLTHRQTLFN